MVLRGQGTVDKERRVSIRGKMAIRGLEIAKKVAIKETRSKVNKLMVKHEEMIDELMDKFVEVITLEEERNQIPLTIGIIAKAITGFDKAEEMRTVTEVTKEVIEEYIRREND